MLARAQSVATTVTVRHGPVAGAPVAGSTTWWSVRPSHCHVRFAVLEVATAAPGQPGRLDPVDQPVGGQLRRRPVVQAGEQPLGGQGEGHDGSLLGVRDQPRSPYDGVSRQPTAATTAAVQAAARPIIQVEARSVPLPIACVIATGQRA